MQIVTNGNRGIATSKSGVPEEQAAANPPGKDRSTASDPSSDLLPGEFGAVLTAEPTLGPQNQEIVDVSLYYHFRAPGPPVWNWTTTTSVSVKDGSPMLLQLDSANPEGDRSHPAKLRGLILKVDVTRLGKLTPRPDVHLGPPPPE